jgi:hypothetical protein
MVQQGSGVILHLNRASGAGAMPGMGSTGPADEGWTRSAARAPRTRLYNIATNACLDSLRSRRRRVPSLHSMAEVPWLQPYPDRLLVGRRQPTAASYLRAPGDTEFRAFKFDVLRIEGGRIAEITTFDATLFPEFGLPPSL